MRSQTPPSRVSQVTLVGSSGITAAQALEVGALVKLKADIDPGDLGPMKVNDVTMLREDDGSENPYRIFHRGEEWWYSAELLVMVDEHSEATTIPQKSRPKKHGQVDLKLLGISASSSSCQCVTCSQ